MSNTRAWHNNEECWLAIMYSVLQHPVCTSVPSLRSHGPLAMIMVNLAKSWLTMVPLSKSWQIMIHGILLKIMISLCTILHGHGVLANIMARSWQYLARLARALSLILGRVPWFRTLGNISVVLTFQQKKKFTGYFHAWVSAKSISSVNPTGVKFCLHQYLKFQ